MTRVETEGKAIVEWARVTPKGLAFLLQSDSPTRALEGWRGLLAINQRRAAGVGRPR